MTVACGMGNGRGVQLITSVCKTVIRPCDPVDCIGRLYYTCRLYISVGIKVGIVGGSMMGLVEDECILWMIFQQ